jgi:hypothetical protein
MRNRKLICHKWAKYSHNKALKWKLVTKTHNSLQNRKTSIEKIVFEIFQSFYIQIFKKWIT